MIDQHSSLMITVLLKDYPEIASSISEKISKSLPEQSLTDLTLIEQIVTSFKKEKGVSDMAFRTGVAKRDIIIIRDALIAVTLLFYQPEKLLRLTTKNTKTGILKRLAALIGTSVEALSMSVPYVVVAFKGKEQFKEEVYRLYELIKTENQFFK